MATTTTPKVTLYWLELSRSQRILWLLEECKIAYEVKTYKRTAARTADPELKKIHPLGKSPVLGIERPGQPDLILAESGLITEYLTEYFAPHLAPKRFDEGKSGPGQETESWLRYRFYMHYAEGSLMPPLVMNLIFNILKEKSPFLVRPIVNGIVSSVDSMFFKPTYATHFSFLESQIASSPDGGQYLCGKDFTSVDILMSFPLQAARSSGIINKETYPKLSAYLARLDEHPSWIAAIKKAEEATGEPFKSSLRE